MFGARAQKAQARQRHWMVISSFARRMFSLVTEEAQEASLFGCTCSGQLQHPAALCAAPRSLYGCDTMVKEVIEDWYCVVGGHFEVH